jgi:hypothetical protein
MDRILFVVDLWPGMADNIHNCTDGYAIHATDDGFQLERWMKTDRYMNGKIISSALFSVQFAK